MRERHLVPVLCSINASLLLLYFTKDHILENIVSSTYLTKEELMRSFSVTQPRAHATTMCLSPVLQLPASPYSIPPTAECQQLPHREASENHASSKMPFSKKKDAGLYVLLTDNLQTRTPK
jgi:hypothetical protein